MVKEDLKQEMLKQTRDNNIACKDAEKISQNRNTAMSEIGATIDLPPLGKLKVTCPFSL